MIREMLIKMLTPKNGTFANPDEWMWDAFGGRELVSGERISEANALQISAVWACVRAISEGTSSLPLNVYRKSDDGGKEKLSRHPVQQLLNNPNPDMTSMVFRETVMAHTLMWGNGYSEIVRNGSGRPVQLWPIDPARVIPKRTDSGVLYYQVTNETGGSVDVNPMSMLHIPGLGYDGVTGYSVIRMAREGLGLTSAAEKFGAALFGNGAVAGGILEHPDKLGDEAHAHLLASMKGRTGAGNAHKTMILEEGMQWKNTSIPPDDAQFLETRKFQIEEIARWFHVPPHKIGHLEKSTNNNIEHQSIEWVVDTIRPWLVRTEQEINRKLFMPSERDLFAEHKVDALLRGDIKGRYEAYQIGRNTGFLSANDIRSLENMNPIEDGDIYLVPLNMTTPDKIGQEPDNQPANAITSALLQNAAHNLANKEANALKKAANQPDFLSWMVNYFAKQEQNRVEMLQISSDVAAQDSESCINLIQSADNLEDMLENWLENRTESLIKMANEVHNEEA
jgi:HK97 family phage portal protein